MAVDLAPISGADIPAVAAFLHTELNQRVPADGWAAAMTVPWKVDAPNHGYLLRDGIQVVGVHLAFYSEREVGGGLERFCNLGAWCVRPEYRFQSLRLLNALLAQPGYTFTDLSPSGMVVPLNERLGFQYLDTTTALVPNLPWPGRPGRASADPRDIEDALAGEPLRIYHDHRAAAAARHVVLRAGDEACYVMFRHDRRKDLPLFASILYASNPAVLARSWPTLGRHLLLHHRVPVTLAEPRVTGSLPRWAVIVRNHRRKMFRGATVTPERVDYLYSELTCVAW